MSTFLLGAPHMTQVDGLTRLGVRWRLRTRFRLWSLMMAVMGLAGALAPIIDSETINSPIFETVRMFGGKAGWFFAWGTLFVLALLAAATARPAVWRAACAVMLMNSVAWFLSVLWEHYVDGVKLSMMGQALWFWCIASTVLVMLAPNQLVGEVVLSDARSL